jgi:hypothetical protein
MSKSSQGTDGVTVRYLTRPGLSAFLHIVCTLADPSACLEAGMSCPILVDSGARVAIVAESQPITVRSQSVPDSRNCVYTCLSVFNDIISRSNTAATRSIASLTSYA